MRRTSLKRQQLNREVAPFRAYPGQLACDPGLGERQIQTAQRIVDLVNEVAAENDCKFK